MATKRAFYLLILISVLTLLCPSTAAAANPVIDNYSHNDCYQAQACSIQMTGHGDPGAVLTWSLVASPAGMAINANSGVITWTPTQAQADTGDHAVQVRLTDAAGGSVTGNFTVHAWRTIISAHFRVRWWAPDGNVTQAYAQRFSTYLENSWNVEVTNYGYNQPPNMAGNLMDIYIHNIAALGSTSNATATEPPKISMDIGMSDDLQKVTAAHEFYHAIQAAYDWNEAWIDEASAVWMEDEVYDAVNDYLQYFADANMLIRKPTNYMQTTYNYGGCPFPIALSEVQNDAAIRTMWAQSVGAGNFVDGAITALGGAAQWRTFWEEFGRRNYDTSRYSEGATFGVRATIAKDYATAGNGHYIFKDGTVYPPPPSLGIKIEHDTFAKFEGSAPGLATYYLRFQVPDQVRNGNTKDTELFLYFNGEDAVHWSVVAYGVLNDGSIGNLQWQVVDPNGVNPGQTGSTRIPVGGNGVADYKEVIIIIGNTDTANTARAFKISGALVPVFQGLYVANADVGTTTTVQNLGPAADANNEGPDEDNVYKNGDSIEIEVDLSDVIHKGGGSPIPRANRSLRTDFTAIDSNATALARIVEGGGLMESLPAGVTAQLEEVTEADAATHKYKIKYTISASNANDGKRVENLPVKMELQDFSLQNDTYINKDATFKVTVDNEPPKVSRVIVTQGPKTIYDSQGGTSEWAKAGTIQVKVIFNESMQTDEADGTDVDATVKFGLNAPYTAHTVTRNGGWSTTTKKNDTWTGSFTIPADQGAQYDGLNTLSITARDQAGNWLDTSTRQPGAAKPDTSHKFKIDSTRPTINTSEEYVGSQECPDLRIDATAKDELNGSMDPNKVSGLKSIRYIVTPPGGWRTINNPGNPHRWNLASVPPRKSVSYQILAEDNAGNTRNSGGGASNNFPGCDKPDDNLSVASPVLAAFNDPTPNRRVDPVVAVLNNGFAPMAQGFLQQLGEPSTLVEVDFSPSMVDDYPVLFIPSGGLYGIDGSATVRARLDEYAQNGGTIIAFDQQHGYEYGALPGAGPDGYGWTEDNSCFNASLYISQYHQALSGFSKASLTSKIDGYFTSYPAGTLVPLNRTKNGMPGLIMYPFGDGWVVATTIYDDFGIYNWQSASDSRTLVRDLISWAIHPAEIPEYDPGDPVTVPVTLTNASQNPATSARLFLLDPNRRVVGQQVVSATVPAGGEAVVNFSTTAGSTLGIWWIDYELLGSTVQEQMRGGRFVVSNPPPSSGPGKQLGLSITAPGESFTDGSIGRFAFHVFNFTDAEKEVEVRYGFPHHTWETGDSSYGNFSNLNRTLTVPPATVVRDMNEVADPSRVVDGMLPGEATFVHEAIMRTTDRLFGYLYSGGRQVDENYFKIWEVPASVNVNVTPERAEYTRGETGRAQVLVTNLSQASYTVTVDIIARDSQNVPFHQETQTATLGSQQTVSITASFVVTVTADAGVARIDATAKDPYGAAVGTGSGAFNVPPSPLVFFPTLPAVLTPGAGATASVLAQNDSPLYGVSGANLAAVLVDPRGTVVADLGGQTFDLGPGGSITLDYPFTVPQPILGDYRFRFTAVDVFGTRTWDTMAASRLALETLFDRPAYRVREPMGFQTTVRNNGSFVEVVTVSASSPVIPGYNASRTVSLAPGASGVLTGSAVLPGSLTAGGHPLVAAVLQPSGGAQSKSSNFSVAESRLTAVLPAPGRAGSGLVTADPHAASGEPFTFTIRNDGGADTTATYTLKVTDSRGNVMHTDGATTGSIAAGWGMVVSSTLPLGLVDGVYTLEVNLTDQGTGRAGTFRSLMHVDGLTAAMSNRTNAEFYLRIDPITATVTISNTDGDIVSGTLTMQVIGSAASRAGGGSRGPLERTALPAAGPSEPETRTDSPSAPYHQAESPAVILAGNPVLVIQNRSPWGFGSLQQVLAANGIPYDQVTSTQIPTIDLSPYELVIIPSNQGSTFNSTFNAKIAKFEAYARAGGKLIVHTADYSDELPIVQGPGGVQVVWGADQYNSVALPDHPMVAGVSASFYGNYASHNVLRNLPAEAVVICTRGSVPGGEPTLAEYPLGTGWVILSGQTLEWAYYYGYQGGIILQNEIPYAYDLKVGKILWEWQTEVNLPSSQVTTVITRVTPLTATGKLYLRSWLDSAEGQRIARADNYPFYVFPGLTYLTVGADREFYGPQQTMEVAGLARNARTALRGGDALTLTSRLTVTLNQAVVHTEGPFVLAPGASRAYAFTTTAPVTTGLVTLIAVMDDVTGTVAMTDTVQIVTPEVEGSAEFPDLVGQAPFRGEISLANTGLVPATVDFAVNAVELRTGVLEGRSPAWSGQVVLGVGESALLQHDYQILHDTRFEVALNGDVTDTLTANVLFGEDAEATFTPPKAAEAGVVEIPYSMENVGELDTRFTTYVTVTRQTGGDGRAAQGEVVATRVITAYLTAPGGGARLVQGANQGQTGILTGSLLIDLDIGDYVLQYRNLFEDGGIGFAVLGLDQLAIWSAVKPVDGSNLPLAGTVVNLGYNHFTGTLRVDVTAMGGGVRGGEPRPWASDEQPFSVEPGGSLGREVLIGQGAEIAHNYPFYNYYENNRSQMLYRGSEIGGSGRITKLAFDISRATSNPGYRVMHDLTIRLKATSASNWNGVWEFADMSGAVTVYGPIDETLPGTIGWVEFDSAPFYIDASKNLIVEVTWGDNGQYTSDSYEVHASDTGDYLVNYGYADSETPPSFDGKSSYRPNLRLELEEWQPVRGVQQAPEGQTTVTLTVGTAAATPGVQQATFRALNGQGQTVQTHTLSFTLAGPDFHVASAPSGSQTQLEVGRNATMTFQVENQGALAGEASLTLELGDVAEETKKAQLIPGELAQLDLVFYVDDDLASGRYLATYVLTGTYDTTGERGDLLVTVQGIDVEVDAAMDQPYYREGDPARLTLTVTNGITRATPALYALASFEGYTTTQPLQLAAGESATVTFDLTATFGGSQRIAFGIYNQETDRAVLLNTLYLRQVHPGVTLITDREVYEPGQVVQVTAVTTATGLLQVEAPGATDEIPLSGGNAFFTFTLPAIMNRGTYAIYHSLEECGCVGEGERRSHEFDVRSTEVRVTEVRLNKTSFSVGETVTATLTIASSESISLTLESWLRYPDGSEGAPVAQTVQLEPILNNHVIATHVITSAQLGEHSLLFRLVGPGNRLFGYRDILNASETVYASGGEIFDVGAATLTGLTTDKAEYRGESEPVMVTMQVFGRAAANGTLTLLLDGQAVWSQPVALSSGFQSFSATLTSQLTPGWRVLAAGLQVAGAASGREHGFAYGTQTPDLTVGAPWLMSSGAVTGEVIGGLVTNQGPVASGPTTLAAYRGDPAAGGTLVGSMPVPGLPAGGSVQVSIDWDASGDGGENQVFLWVNRTEIVPEYNRENNQADAVLTVPRLGLEAATGQPAYGQGETVAIISGLENRQNSTGLSLTLTTTVRLATFGAPVVLTDTRPVSLTAGEQRTIALEWDSAGQDEGDYQVDQEAVDEFGTRYLASAGFAVGLTDLSVSTQANPFEVQSGEVVTYRIAFANASDVPASNVVLTQTLPAGMSLDSVITPTALLNGPLQVGSALVWTADSLPAGAGGTIGIGARVEPTTATSGTYASMVQIATTTAEARSDNNQASAANALLQFAALSLSKSDGQGEVEAGQRLTYTLYYANAGPADASGVMVVDTLPAALIYESCDSGGAGSCIHQSGVVTFTLGDLAALGSGTLQVVVTALDPLPGGEAFVVNAASISARTLDMSPADNTAYDLDLIPGAGGKVFLPLVLRS